jgi:uncharacterized protein YjdB
VFLRRFRPRRHSPSLTRFLNQILTMKRLSSALRCVLGGGLLAVAMVGCKDATSTNTKPVASIEITGVPAELYVGANVTLGATLKDADGNQLSNRPVTWISSDSTIARVTGGVVTGRRPGQAVIVATSEQKSTTAVITVGIEPVATVEITGIPSGPVASGTTVQLTAVARNATGQVLPGRPIFWMSSNYNLATVTGTGLVQAVSGGNVLISASAEGKTASFTLQVFDPVTSVSVSPASAGLYPTQTMQLTATPRSAAGAPLTGRAITWTTSDASKATVDATGTVTAVGQGQVTITATAEGVGGMSNLTILARPAADWSQAADWATYQGNARHTGFVPVTADPVAFREKWVRTPLGNAPLNPVTEGGGRVFVTSNNYSGTHSLAAVNTQSGANAWTYNFTVDGLHPPAYGNGRVYVTTSGHQNSFLWAFDAAAGTVQFRSGYGNQWSHWFAPVVTADAVYMAGGYYGGMYSFTTTDGTERWFAETNQYDEWTPAVADGRVYAYTGDYDPKLAVHDAATGAELYTIADPNFSWNGWSMHVSPVLGGLNNVLATQGNRLISFNLQSRTVGWERTGTFRGNVTVADGVLYVMNNNQVEARRESDGSLLWVWIPPGGQQPQGTMIVTRNMLFVSTGSHTYGIDIAARLMTWSYNRGGQLALGRDGILFIAGGNGQLAAVDLK